MIVLCTVLCCVLSIINTCTMHCICITLQGGASSAWNVFMGAKSLLFQYCIVFVLHIIVFVFASYLYHTAMDGEHPLLGMFLLGVTSLLLQYSRGTALPSEPRIFSEDNTCTSAFVQRRCCRNCTFSVSCRVRLQCSSSSCVPDCTRGFPLKLPGTQILRN